MTTSPRTLLVVDDEPFIRDGLHAYFVRKGYQVHCTSDTESALQLAHLYSPDVCIVDIVVKEKADQVARPRTPQGLPLATRLRRSFPNLAIVLFSAFPEYASQVVELANNGFRSLSFRLKGCSPTDMEIAVERALAGEVFLDEALQADASFAVERILSNLDKAIYDLVQGGLDYFDQLSPRELIAAHFRAAGWTTNGIAARMGISPGSVENCLGRVYDKLGLHDVSDQVSRPMVLEKICLIHDLGARGSHPDGRQTD